MNNTVEFTDKEAGGQSISELHSSLYFLGKAKQNHIYSHLQQYSIQEPPFELQFTSAITDRYQFQVSKKISSAPKFSELCQLFLTRVALSMHFLLIESSIFE